MNRKIISMALAVVASSTIVLNSVDFAVAEPKTSENCISNIVDVCISEADNVYIRVALSGDKSTGKDTSVDITENSEVSTGDEVNLSDVAQYLDQAVEELNKEKEYRKRGYTTTNFQGGLVDIFEVDNSYSSYPISITGNDRDILERLVMGEAGSEGFIGAALVAQALRDAYVMGGYSSIAAVRRDLKYSGSIKLPPNQNVLDAVHYIFDNGGYAVKHRLIYMYQSKIMYSKFHESQNFILNYQGVKFFDRIK